MRVRGLPYYNVRLREPITLTSVVLLVVLKYVFLIAESVTPLRALPRKYPTLPRCVVSLAVTLHYRSVKSLKSAPSSQPTHSNTAPGVLEMRRKIKEEEANFTCVNGKSPFAISHRSKQERDSRRNVCKFQMNKTGISSGNRSKHRCRVLGEDPWKLFPCVTLEAPR